MRLLRLLSRVAFICNICFVLASLARYVPSLPDNDLVSTIIVLGYVLSILVNILVNVWIGVVWAFRKGPLMISRWLWIINLIFLIIQILVILLFMYHS